jgi:diguanylate cyclase (GGDEF)-like protein
VERRLRRAALLDPLTGLANRAMLEQRLQELLRTASEQPGRTYAVLFIDLDNFKYVNFSLGHATGDRLLIEVARRITTAAGAPELPEPDSPAGSRLGPLAARFGGDEFVVVLDDLQGPDEASAVARRIHEAMAQPVEIDGREIAAQCSIGIATGGGCEGQPDLLRDADTAMAHAKATGKGRHAAFDEPMLQMARRRLQLETDLRAAVRDDRIHTAYQPIVHLESGRVVSFEALARWRHADFGWVSPAEFIPIAEETGLIVPLSNALLERAVALLEEFDKLPGGDRVRMNVNISRRQLADAEFLPTLDALVSRMAVAPSRLCLEITESTVTTAPRRIGESLHAIKELGVQLHLDDFGTGLSSLSLLRTLPFDGIKVDRSFIDAAAGSREAIAILHAIVTLGRNLRKVTTAEGLETTTHMATVLALECDLAQGWLLGRPVGPAEAAPLLGRDCSLKVREPRS